MTFVSCLEEIVFFHLEKVTINPDPPFTPDLAPFDYFLFRKLKYHLSGERYNLEMPLDQLFISI